MYKNHKHGAFIFYQKFILINETVYLAYDIGDRIKILVTETRYWGPISGWHEVGSSIRKHYVGSIITVEKTWFIKGEIITNNNLNWIINRKWLNNVESIKETRWFCQCMVVKRFIFIKVINKLFIFIRHIFNQVLSTLHVKLNFWKRFNS